MEVSSRSTPPRLRLWQVLQLMSQLDESLGSKFHLGWIGNVRLESRGNTWQRLKCFLCLLKQWVLGECGYAGSVRGRQDQQDRSHTPMLTGSTLERLNQRSLASRGGRLQSLIIVRAGAGWFFVRNH
jgi:hypothetical protein